ncbi:MAG: hypothetical protein ACT4NY_18705 [Pseudonocardiales bacterium]
MGVGSGGGLTGGGWPRYFAASSDTGNILANALGVGSTGQSFTIDVEHAPQSIADLRAAADFLEHRAGVALGLADVRAPGADGVSRHAAEQISKWAVDSGVNNLHATLLAGAQQLRDLAAKLEADLKSYLQVDELPSLKASEGLPPL